MGVTFVHYNPDIFAEPFKFQPQRWIGPDVRGLDNFLLSFGKGPRSCLGVKYVCPSYFCVLKHNRVLHIASPGVSCI